MRKRTEARPPISRALRLLHYTFWSQIATTPNALMSQFVTSNPAAKMSLRRRPYAFTEHGVAMLSSVLKSERAVQVNIQIMREFLRMRQLLASQKGLMEKLLAMEKKYDEQFKIVFEAIRQLMIEEEKPKKQIGFKTKDGK